jgi:hypothetical protein
MKISELVAAFQRYAEPQDRKAEAAADSSTTTTSRRAEAAALEERTGDTDDIVTLSPQAVFLFAASQFDPQRITRREIGELSDTLLDGGAISERDHGILTSATASNGRTGSFGSEFQEGGDLIGHFQERLSRDMAKSDVGAVEADTRALSILGRLASIREELL